MVGHRPGEDEQAIPQVCVLAVHNCFTKLATRKSSVLFGLESCSNNDPGENHVGILADFH